MVLKEGGLGRGFERGKAEEVAKRDGPHRAARPVCVEGVGSIQIRDSLDIPHILV